MQVKDQTNQWRDARKPKRGGSGQIFELLYFRNRKEFAADFFCVFILPIDEQIVWIWAKSEGVTWQLFWKVVVLAWNDPLLNSISTPDHTKQYSLHQWQIYGRLLLIWNMDYTLTFNHSFIPIADEWWLICMLTIFRNDDIPSPAQIENFNALTFRIVLTSPF